MPYIKKAKRRKFDEDLERIEEMLDVEDFEGELNYLVTHLCKYLYEACPDYQRINGLVGALECAKLELYRRVAVPYEDRKILQNGDVYN